jgi:hypothetical protein
MPFLCTSEQCGAVVFAGTAEERAAFEERRRNPAAAQPMVLEGAA